MQRIRVCASAVLFLLALVATRPVDAKPPTPPQSASPALKDYVKMPDNSYAWKVRQRGQFGSGSFVELILTSQTWRDIVWKHQLFIYRPAEVKDSTQALLLIDGGSWRDSLESDPPAEGESLPKEARVLVLLADMLGTPVAVIKQVPEQPILDGRKEDAIIALTFEKFLETGDSDWPLLLPMVKTAVRAMDTIQTFAKEEWQLNIEHFTVTGASKRGWTTWLTAATDARVNALAPMVINMLNMVAHDELQKASFGGYSDEISDYSERNLHDHLSTAQGAALRAIVDPYSYRKQLLQPKLIILGTNDAYWPVDSLNLYWNELEGDKYILYVPNNGHSINDYPRVVASIAALHQSVNGGKPLPKLDWQVNQHADGAQLELSADIAPSAVRLWTAEADTRDFRKSEWTAQPLTANGGDGHTFVADLKKPKEGFNAMFVEAEFPGEPVPFNLSTTLHVFPDFKPGETASGGGSQ